MTDFYSVTLGFAIAASVAALGLALASRRNPRGGDASKVLSLAALLLVSISGVSHYVAGHARGTSAVLGPLAFLLEHPALGVTAAVAALALFLLRRGT